MLVQNVLLMRMRMSSTFSFRRLYVSNYYNTVMVDGWVLLGGLLLATGLFVYIRVCINCVCLSVSDYESSATMLQSRIYYISNTIILLLFLIFFVL